MEFFIEKISDHRGKFSHRKSLQFSLAGWDMSDVQIRTKHHDMRSQKLVFWILDLWSTFLVGVNYSI